MTRARSRAIAIVVVTAIVFPLSIAFAQSPEAEVLFREGRRLAKQGKLAEACDKFEASERFESSVGTLLNLGDCREKLGRLASAWAAFRMAEDKAKRAGDDDKRMIEAGKRAARLEAKVPTLVIWVDQRTTGLIVRRDGEVVDQALWNTAVPVDTDTYEIVAEAPGYKRWRTLVPVDGRMKRRVVFVPALERAPVPVTARAEPGGRDPQQRLRTPRVTATPASLPGTGAPPRATMTPATAPKLVAEMTTRRAGTWTPLRQLSAGLVLAGAGAFGAGIYYGLRSDDLEERADARCPLEVCDDALALRWNDEAQRAARRANILYAAGGGAVVVSVVMWLVGTPSEETVVTPAIAGDHAGVTIGGTF